MKKFIKIFFISLLSLFSVLLITVCVLLFLVFTPERFTPIVHKQVDKLITCRSELGQVELTFFSTFPDFGVKIRNLALINPSEDSMFDTLLQAKEFIGTVDAAAWWKRNELIIKGLELRGGSVNVFSDSLGNTNYNIMATDTVSAASEEAGTGLPVIDIRNVVLDDVSFHYKDLALKLNTAIRDLSASISGTVRGDKIAGEIKVKKSVISLEYGNEKYLRQANINFDIPVNFETSRQRITLKNARASINDLEFLLNGSIENDTVSKEILTDLNYQFASWPIEKIIALVPPSFTSYLKDIEAGGLISSEGTIKGSVTETAMPLLNIHLLLEKGTMEYSGFSLPLHDIEGDITVVTDLKSDSASFVKIERFRGKTPKSVFSVEGRVNHLFNDIFFNLTTTAGLTFDEFDPLIPDSLKLKIKGQASGRIKSAFSLKQLEKMQMEKMKLEGSLSFKNLDVVYDSLTLKTDRSTIDFSFPNRKPQTKNTKFVVATVQGNNISLTKLDSYYASLQNASFAFETSDARDTTRISDVICSFTIDSLSANMDTMSIAVAKPHGKLSLSPQAGRPDQPRIELTYGSEKLITRIGPNSLSVNTISFNTDILNDNDKKEIFLQWLAKGYVDMEQGIIDIAGLSHPVEIPSLKMKFDPETFNIQDGTLKIGKSDFRLTGDLTNILSFFRGDSILRGKFNFVSGNTDIGELMVLTNGIGNKDTTATKSSGSQNADTVQTGPYMVPMGMDLQLDAQIKTATIGIDTASNINGSIRVHDGVLVLDGLTFDTPAARMQLTAIYRTPRKNHIFLGLDYHMLDIEIGELLTMIPDIDSLMPMLRSFSGKGEFHIAVETYLDSLYNIKKSTLRGASSIKGNNLVLMDGETFSEIAKTLRFNKKTQNRVDSLSAEFTIFRNEIDVYPFLIVLDKYKAIVAGRHNFDLTYDYHISLVDSPIPIKLGIDVKGNPDNMTYKLAKCRYAEYYRPSSRHEVANKQLELRKLIRETLTQKVKE